MDFQAAIKTINKDFSNLYFAKYLKAQWGIVAGYRTVPDYLARMRKQLADWQLANDCNDDLCLQSKLQVYPLACPPGYVLSISATSLSASSPTNVCINQACNICPTVDPSDPLITILEYGTFADPCTCVLNPPLEAYGSSCFDRHWWNGNFSEILMASFTR